MVWLKVPLRPTHTPLDPGSGRGKQSPHRVGLVRMAVNRAVLSLRALLTPDLGCAEIRLERLRCGREWSRAAPLDREAYTGLEQRMWDFREMVGFEEVDGRGSYERLGRHTQGYSLASGSTTAGPKTAASEPVRGEVVPLEVENLGLPPPGLRSVPLVRHSIRAKFYFDHFQEMMLTNQDLEQSAEEEQPSPPFRPYSDPSLKKRSVMLELAGRMWLAGMLSYCRECISEICLFAVFKRLNPDGTYNTRPVLDLRGVNLAFQAPPWASMASPASLSELQLGEKVRRGRVVASAQGDLPDYFSTLETPPVVHPYFCLPTISAREFWLYMKERGHDIPEPGEDEAFLAMKVLPQGWSWSLFFSQVMLEEVLLAPSSPLKEGGLMGYRS